RHRRALVHPRRQPPLVLRREGRGIDCGQSNVGSDRGVEPRSRAPAQGSSAPESSGSWGAVGGPLLSGAWIDRLTALVPVLPRTVVGVMASPTLTDGVEKSRYCTWEPSASWTVMPPVPAGEATTLP